MAPELGIPSVTREDLANFHRQTFGLEAPSASLPEADTDAGISHESSTDLDDGLGYYPDGVKRTLTDEQIAMFRHSETYNIIRQRQLAKERQSNGEDSPNLDDTTAGGSVRTTTGRKDIKESRFAMSKNKRRKLKKAAQKANVKDDNLPSRREIRELDARLDLENEALDYD